MDCELTHLKDVHLAAWVGIYLETSSVGEVLTLLLTNFVPAIFELKSLMSSAMYSYHNILCSVFQ